MQLGLTNNVSASDFILSSDQANIMKLFISTRKNSSTQRIAAKTTTTLILLLAGDYLIVESIEEGKKVTCEMVHILYPDQIQDLKSEKVWPQRFYSESEEETERGKSFKGYRNTKPIDSEGSDSDDSLEANVNQMNRPVVYMSSDSKSEDD